MGGIQTGGSKIHFKKARTYRGKCNKCGKPIIPGEMYIDEIRIGGLRTGRQGQAHKSCY